MAQSVTRAVGRLRHLLAVKDAAGESDVDLLRRFANRADSAAFEAIVRRHGPMVLGVCRRLLRDSADADDSFQATFCILARKASALSRPERLAGWLFQVAYRTARRARGLRQRRQANQVPLPEIAVASPVAQIVWRELQPIFDEEVSRLPENLRLPVVLCFLEGQTKRSAAKNLGWPEGTFSCRLQQARELLRSRLSRRGVTLSAGALAVALFQGTATAAVSSSLASATINSAALAATGATLSGPAAVLAHGVLHSMYVTKLKIAAVLVLTVGVFGSGTGWVLHGAGSNSAYADAADDKAPRKSADRNLSGRDVTPDISTGAFALKHASAVDAARIIQQLFDGNNQIRLTFDEATNTLFVRAGDADLTKIRAIIEQLDAPRDSAGDLLKAARDRKRVEEQQELAALEAALADADRRCEQLRAERALIEQELAKLKEQDGGKELDDKIKSVASRRNTILAHLKEADEKADELQARREHFRRAMEAVENYAEAAKQLQAERDRLTKAQDEAQVRQAEIELLKKRLADLEAQYEKLTGKPRGQKNLPDEGFNLKVRLPSQQAKLAEAEANLKQYEERLEWTRRMVQKGFLAKWQQDHALTEVEAARALLEQAKANLDAVRAADDNAATDVRIAEAEYKQAAADLQKYEALLNVKQADLARLEKLVANNLVSKEELLKARADVEVATAELNRAKAAVERAKAVVDRAQKGVAAPPTDARVAEAEYQQAAADLQKSEAQLRLRQAESARIQKLVAEKAVDSAIADKARADLEVATAEVKRAQAAVERAKVMLDRAQRAAPYVDPPLVKRKAPEGPVADAETKLERLNRLRELGEVSEAEVDRARLAVAEARIVAELRGIVDIRERAANRAAKQREAGLISQDDYKRAVDALDAAKRRLAEWK
jgi:RNA polymerase sigma factor (sigma-70 family)